MKKRLKQTSIFLSVILSITLFFASPVWVKDTWAGVETSFTVSLGSRQDNLDWNIAGNIHGNSPNILSELIWSDLEIFQVKVDGKIIIDNKFYIRGAVDHGKITDGNNRDSDYLGDDRTNEFSRSYSKTDNGDVMDALVGFGYQFRPVSSKFTIAPVFGYSYHKQNLVMTDGRQTIPPTGDFSGLDSTYNAQWKGPFVGIDLSLKIMKQLELSGAFEYHWVDYAAVADWNLREDFQHPNSFEHSADGDGISAAAALNYAFNSRWGLNLAANYRNWSADHGSDRIHFSDGTESETRLNEVNWDSTAIELGLKLSF